MTAYTRARVARTGIPHNSHTVAKVVHPAGEEDDPRFVTCLPEKPRRARGALRRGEGVSGSGGGARGAKRGHAEMSQEDNQCAVGGAGRGTATFSTQNVGATHGMVGRAGGGSGLAVAASHSSWAAPSPALLSDPSGVSRGRQEFGRMERGEEEEWTRSDAGLLVLEEEDVCARTDGIGERAGSSAQARVCGWGEAARAAAAVHGDREDKSGWWGPGGVGACAGENANGNAGGRGHGTLVRPAGREGGDGRGGGVGGGRWAHLL